MSVAVLKRQIARERADVMAKAKVAVDAAWAEMEARQAEDAKVSRAQVRVYHEREAQLEVIRAARAARRAEEEAAREAAEADKPAPAGKGANAAAPVSGKREEKQRYDRLWRAAKAQGADALARFKAEWSKGKAA